MRRRDRSAREILGERAALSTLRVAARNYARAIADAQRAVSLANDHDGPLDTVDVKADLVAWGGEFAGTVEWRSRYVTAAPRWAIAGVR